MLKEKKGGLKGELSVAWTFLSLDKETFVNMTHEQVYKN